MKFRPHELFLGVFLTVAVFAIGFVASSTREPQTAQEQNLAKSLDKTDHKSSADERVADYTLAVAWLTGVLAVSTIGLWIVTWRSGIRQSRDMEASIVETRRIGEAQTRAYVSISAAQIGFMFNAGAPAVSFVAFNSGQSPARNFVWNIKIQYPAPEINREVSFNVNWLREAGMSIPATTTAPPESAIVSDMSAKQYVEPGGLSVTVIRAKIDFRFTDVFDQDWFGEAYFSGLIQKRTDGQMADTPWIGKISPTPKPRDWDKIRKASET
jgi:hypothetical protein